MMSQGRQGRVLTYSTIPVRGYLRRQLHLSERLSDMPLQIERPFCVKWALGLVAY